MNDVVAPLRSQFIINGIQSRSWERSEFPKTGNLYRLDSNINRDSNKDEVCLCFFGWSDWCLFQRDATCNRSFTSSQVRMNRMAQMANIS